MKEEKSEKKLWQIFLELFGAAAATFFAFYFLTSEPTYMVDNGTTINQTNTWQIDDEVRTLLKWITGGVVGLLVIKILAGIATAFDAFDIFDIF